MKQKIGFIIRVDEDLKRHLSKSLTVVIQLLSTSLIKPNF